MNDDTTMVPVTGKPIPRVSIGMPVYNGEKFIRDALDSLLAQTFSDFELIISDNASTDDTEAICRDYAAKDVRIRYVRQAENLGAAANFKFVLDEAVGEYFMWAAHDDRRSTIAIERMLEVFNADENVGLVFSDMVTKDLITGSEKYYSVGYISSHAKKYKKYLYRLLNGSPSLIYGLHRKAVLNKFRLANYDYMDVHLTHWYELNSTVKVIPLFLYVAGTDGVRNPYSLTGKKITISTYLAMEWRELIGHFNFHCAGALYMIAAFLIYKNTRLQNKRID